MVTEDRKAATAPRRAVLAVGTVGVAAGVVGALSGCQVYGRPDEAAPAPPPPPPPASSDGDDGDGDDGDGDGDDGQGEGDGGPAADALASTAEVAVGGGLILADQGIVVTQPTAGEFRGFSATCTHQGCTVSSVSDGTINCACHNSRFSIEDGSVVQAAQGLSPDQQDPLPQRGVAVDGDAITLA